MTNFTKKIQDFIRKNQLLRADGKYLVALSGGADSVALLVTLHELGYQIEACHCNFHLRGEESDRDEHFCVHLCQQLDIPLHRIHFDTHTYAELHKESIELAARNLRYNYFEQLRKDVEADGICVAHHQDDSVETVLINLIRGTGLQGLTGISPKNGFILRPLLCIDRKAILEFLAEKKQEYVTDSTNLVDDVVRNKIRLNIIPMLKEINPAVCNNIAATARYVEGAVKTLDYYFAESRKNTREENGDEKKVSTGFSEDDRNKKNEVSTGFSEDDRNKKNGVSTDFQEKDRNYKNGNCISETKVEDDRKKISKDWVLSQGSSEYALYYALSPFGFTGKVIGEILESIHTVGKTWKSASHRLLIDRENLLVEELSDNQFKSIKIPESGNYVFRSADGKEQKIKVKAEERQEDFVPSKEKYVVTLDTDKIAFPLTLRAVQEGDAFHPFGMKGKKLVSDFLTDKKKNLFEKERQLILADASGMILWVVGERTSELCKIQDSTKAVLRIEILLQDCPKD